MDKIYRLCRLDEWQAAEAQGHLLPNADDQRDGFLHLSTAEQVAITARKYYAQVPDLFLLGISMTAVEPILRWEASTSGEVYPHAYGEVPVSAVLFAKPVPRYQGQYQFTKEIFTKEIFE
ncbi:MAG: hypothetical protein COA47_15125 [Robiginitomaculum sp.]|nr:MAG: hypothetical protein COA47_15125 [Robiginitomaculum sp.]